MSNGADNSYNGLDPDQSSRKAEEKRKKQKEEEEKRKEQEKQNQLKEQREKHVAEMDRLQSVISDLKTQGQSYANMALRSQQTVEENNQAIADVIRSRSDVNLQQEEDTQGALERKKKNQSRIGTGITKADML